MMYCYSKTPPAVAVDGNVKITCKVYGAAVHWLSVVETEVIITALTVYVFAYIVHSSERQRIIQINVLHGHFILGKPVLSRPSGPSSANIEWEYEKEFNE